MIAHPSGKNRWWNETRNVRRCPRFLIDVVENGKLPLKVSGGPCR